MIKITKSLGKVEILQRDSSSVGDHEGEHLTPHLGF